MPKNSLSANQSPPKRGRQVWHPTQCFLTYTIFWRTVCFWRTVSFGVQYLLAYSIFSKQWLKMFSNEQAKLTWIGRVLGCDGKWLPKASRRRRLVRFGVGRQAASRLSARVYLVVLTCPTIALFWICQSGFVGAQAVAGLAQPAAGLAQPAAGVVNDTADQVGVDSLDAIAKFQHHAIAAKSSPIAHWGWDPENYVLWGTHSNRLLPIYTFGTKGAGKGIDLQSYTGENSIYRDQARLTRLFGQVTEATVNPEANYMDQTEVFSLQQAALEAGKKNIFLVVFDGMDWQTTWAAAIVKTGKVPYAEGRGSGLHFQDYTASRTTQFAAMGTSPHNDGTNVNVDSQSVQNPGGKMAGGYDVSQAGDQPWSQESVPQYLVGKGGSSRHAYTDSASSATSMTSGIKTYNNAIGVDAQGNQVVTIAHAAQRMGYKVGAVSSVPISHATPACAYAHNVHRNDYQDLTRDMLGLPSISHPGNPMPGMDVVIGGGFGTEREKDSGQGENFVPGNATITAADLAAVEKDPKDAAKSGKYRIAQRTAGVNGAKHLAMVANQAAAGGDRLLGFYGAKDNGGHLPFATANGDYVPVQGRTNKSEVYAAADLEENPTLAQMTAAALVVLEKNEQGMWLMVEAGDVDWANHDNNLDNSVGAVFSGDAAVKVITDWVEQNSNWNDSVLIVTADHGHYLVIEDPAALAEISQK